MSCIITSYLQRNYLQNDLLRTVLVYRVAEKRFPLGLPISPPSLPLFLPSSYLPSCYLRSNLEQCFLTQSISRHTKNSFATNDRRSQAVQASDSCDAVSAEVSKFPCWLRWYRICLQCRRPGFYPWVRKIPWRRGRLPIPVFLPGEFHGQRILTGYSPWGHKESDTTEATQHAHTCKSLGIPVT